MKLEIATLIVFLSGFITTYLLVPKAIEKLKKRGHVVKDMYKKGRPKVPTLGGLVILFGVLASLVASQLLFQFFVNEENLVRRLLVFYTITVIFAVFGLYDDLLGIDSHKFKIIFPFFLALPIALLNVDTTLDMGPVKIPLGVFYSLIIAPLYVMVVANLVNMHSGFNGLCVGLSLILLATIALKAYARYGMEEFLLAVPLLASTFAFLLYNKYPSRIFEGNTGAYMLGASIGGLLVLYNLEFFGIFVLIPHIINFLMYIAMRLKKLHKKKFGSVDSKGYLKVPNPYTLKWFLPYFFKMTELQATIAMYLLTTVFCILGFLLF